MRRRALAAATIVVLVGLLAAGCGTPPPEAIEPRYTNPAWGLSMWYPDDLADYWEDEFGVQFGSSDEGTIAHMSVVCADLEDQTLDVWAAWLTADLISFLRLESSVGEARTIGGQEGYLAPMEATFEGGRVVRGFTAAVEHEGWGYFFAAWTDEWTEYEPVLMRMLDSVQFTAPGGSTPGTTG